MPRAGLRRRRPRSIPAYSSWIAMHTAHETNADLCNFNDLELVKLDPTIDVSQVVNPSVPFWGGPTALRADLVAGGENVYSYGNSELRGGAQPLSPKQGTCLDSSANGWTYDVYTASP